MDSTNRARTILGPLTTSYTVPSSCSILFEQCSTCGQGWHAQTCYASTVSGTVDYGVSDDTACWPPTSSFAPTPPIPLGGWGFYSPGLICPSGMVSACSATAGRSSEWPVQFGLLSEETAVGCCPSGYTCANTWRQTCVTTATETSLSVVTCESGTSVFAYLTVPTTVTATATSTTGGTGAVSTQSQFMIFAPLIQINWQPSDRLHVISVSTLKPTSTTAPGLSTGSKAGIGIGVALGVISLIALAVFIYWHRRNAYARARQDSSGATNPVYEMNSENKGSYTTSELPSGRPVSELPAWAENRIAVPASP